MKSSLTTKISLVIFFCSLVGALLLGAVFVYQQQLALEEGVARMRQTLYENYDKAARNEVEIAVSVLQQMYDRSQKGEMTLDEAKKKAADIVRDMRYEKDEGYFWIDTVEGINIVLLGKASEGTNRLNIQDKKGQYLVKELIKVAQQPGGGHMDYWWPRAGSDEPLPKRGYTLLFKPFNWVVGTGNYVDDMELKISTLEQQYKAKFRNGMIALGAVLLIVVFMAFGVSYLFSKRLSRQLGLAVSVADRLAEGDLTATVQVESKDEIGQLLASMQNMIKSLREMISKIVHISSGISTVSEQIYSTSEHIAKGTESAAAQAAAVNSASEEMTAASDGITKSCIAATDLSGVSAKSASEGEVVVLETIAGMDQIAERVTEISKTIASLGVRSEQIGKIVGTIDEIADQTNLLALNAAIEAARAGEQGRGFAVVADEVRALAERTTKATREIGEMIKTIQQETKAAVTAMNEAVVEVEKGSETAHQSEAALKAISESIHEVAGQVEQIASAARLQLATNNNVSQSIQQIADVIHETADGAETTATASGALSDQAKSLQDLIKQFKL